MFVIMRGRHLNFVEQGLKSLAVVQKMAVYCEVQVFKYRFILTNLKATNSKGIQYLDLNANKQPTISLFSSQNVDAFQVLGKIYAKFENRNTPERTSGLFLHRADRVTRQSGIS